MKLYLTEEQAKLVMAMVQETPLKVKDMQAVIPLIQALEGLIKGELIVVNRNDVIDKPVEPLKE
jgi:hypothetical protein